MRAQETEFEIELGVVSYKVLSCPERGSMSGYSRISTSNEVIVLALPQPLDQQSARIVLRGYLLGFTAGKKEGEISFKTALRNLLDIPSLSDIEALDGRIDTVSQHISEIDHRTSDVPEWMR